jgi:outer membrane protein TolC
MDTLDVSDTAGVTLADFTDAHYFLSQAAAYDPQTKIFEILKEKLTVQLDNDRNNLLPQIDLAGSYTYTHAISPPMPGENASPGNNSVISLILNYSIPSKPLWIAKMKTGLALRENDLKSADYRADLENRVREMFFTWQMEKKNLGIAETSKELARRYFEAANQGFERGSVDRLTLDKARNDFQTQAVLYIQQLISLKKIEVLFDEISGAVFPRFGVTFQ